MQRRTELVAVCVFGQTVHLGAIFDAVVNQPEAKRHHDLTFVCRIRYFKL